MGRGTAPGLRWAWSVADRTGSSPPEKRGCLKLGSQRQWQLRAHLQGHRVEWPGALAGAAAAGQAQGDGLARLLVNAWGHPAGGMKRAHTCQSVPGRGQQAQVGEPALLTGLERGGRAEGAAGLLLTQAPPGALE